MTDAQRASLDLVSRALEYPDHAYYESLPLLRDEAKAILDESGRGNFLRFLDRLANLGLTGAQEAYVATFDHDPQSSLYMAWHRYGNDRGQGRALAALNGLYRSAGLEPIQGSMPDYLPRMLEFMAISEAWAIEIMLDGFGPEIVRLISHLKERQSPYAEILEMALDPLRLKWPEFFRPRNTPDPTIRPMARPEAETLESLDTFAAGHFSPEKEL